MNRWGGGGGRARGGHAPAPGFGYYIFGFPPIKYIKPPPFSRQPHPTTAPPVSLLPRRVVVGCSLRAPPPSLPPLPSPLPPSPPSLPARDLQVYLLRVGCLGIPDLLALGFFFCAPARPPHAPKKKTSPPPIGGGGGGGGGEPGWLITLLDKTLNLRADRPGSYGDRRNTHWK